MVVIMANFGAVTNNMVIMVGMIDLFVHMKTILVSCLPLLCIFLPIFLNG